VRILFLHFFFKTKIFLITLYRILTVGKRSENDSISALDDPTVFQAGNVSKSFDNRDDWTIANNTLGDESLVQVPTDGAYARIYGQSSRSISSTGSSDANATRDDTLMSKDIKSHNENIGQQRIEIDAPSGKVSNCDSQNTCCTRKPLTYIVESSLELSLTLQVLTKPQWFMQSKRHRCSRISYMLEIGLSHLMERTQEL